MDEIAAIGLGHGGDRGLVLGPVGVELGQPLEPGRGRLAQRLLGQSQGLMGELGVALLQQRQVEQPLARIVDDLQGQVLDRLDLAQHQALGPVSDLQAQRGQPVGGPGPARRLRDEVGVEARVGKAVGGSSRRAAAPR